MPKISILCPVYNIERYIAQTIESVQAQTEQDWELLLIDDCSTDSSKAIMEQYAAKDNRLRIFSTPTNSWAHAAANVGLDNARGDYIAILDGDDVLPAYRFKTQLDFFNANPHVDVCGGWLQNFGDDTTLIQSYQQADVPLRTAILFDSPLAHGTAMIRRAIIEAHHIRYNTAIYYTHDYDFFAQLAFDAGAVFASIPKVLYYYRIHGGQTTALRRKEIQQNADKIRLSVLARFGVTNPEMQALHLAICNKKLHKIAYIPNTLQEVRKINAQTPRELNTEHTFMETLKCVQYTIEDINQYYDALLAGNRYLEKQAFAQCLSRHIAKQLRRSGLKAWKQLSQFHGKQALNWTLTEKARFYWSFIRL
jgi:hypothetical protein